MTESHKAQTTDRWSIARYGAAAVAATAGLLATTPAQAAIIYTNPEPDVVGGEFPPGTGLNMDNAGPDEYTFGASGPFAGIAGTIPGNTVAAFLKPVEIKDDVFIPVPFANPLTPGTPIPGSQNFFPSVSFAVGDFNPWDTAAFAGLQFLLGSNTHFGWAQFHVAQGINGLAVTLFDYAYCDQPNQAINAGQTEGECGASTGVPEPSSLLLLATGAVAVEALRRWRRRADAA